MKTIFKSIFIISFLCSYTIFAQVKNTTIIRKTYSVKPKLKPKQIEVATTVGSTMRKDTMNFGKLKIKTFDLKSQAYYPYGDEALFTFIAHNLKYSQADINKKVDGKVLLRFDVDVDSTVKEVRVIKDPCVDCGHELVKIFENFKFAPALTNKGTPMRSNLMLEIPVWAH